MGFLAGKRILITGLISNRSIAYGIAKACRREGAELAFTYQNERFKDRMAKFADEAKKLDGTPLLTEMIFIAAVPPGSQPNSLKFQLIQAGSVSRCASAPSSARPPPARCANCSCARAFAFA